VQSDEGENSAPVGRGTTAGGGRGDSAPVGRGTSAGGGGGDSAPVGRGTAEPFWRAVEGVL